MLRILTAQQVTQFRLNGFLAVEDVLSAAEVERIATHCDRIAAGTVTHMPATSIQLEQVFRDGAVAVVDPVLAVRKLFNLAVYDDSMWSLVTHTMIVDIIADLLGSDDIKLYGDQLMMKPPAVGSEQPWHQDSASWRDIFPMDLITAWTALDHATVDNGCLNCAPGTHRWGMLRSAQLANFLGDLGREHWPIVAAPLRPRSISFHHTLVLHQSNSNRSGARRRGYAPRMPPFKQVRGSSFLSRV